MANPVRFDNEKYLREQDKKILEGVETFDNKLFLEFGGITTFDYHAAKILAAMPN